MSFSHAIALTESQPGHYAGQIAEGWDIGGNANGGYILALAANGLRQHLGRPDPVSITAHYLRPGKVGPAAVHCETVKEGKRFATARATLEGPGGAVLSVLGTFAISRTARPAPPRCALSPRRCRRWKTAFPWGPAARASRPPSWIASKPGFIPRMRPSATASPGASRRCGASFVFLTKTLALCWACSSGSMPFPPPSLTRIFPWPGRRRWSSPAICGVVPRQAGSGLASSPG